MKIAVPTNGEKLGDLIAPHFGRAENFIVLDSEKGEFQTYENPEAAGKQELPPHFLHKLNVQAVICFGLGQKAIDKFNKWDITVYRAKQGSVSYNWELFQQDQLEELYS